MSSYAIISTGCLIVVNLLNLAYFIKDKRMDNAPGETGAVFAKRFVFCAVVTAVLTFILVALVPYTK